MKFLVVVETSNGQPHRMSLEAIAGAQQMAQELGGDITVMAMGDQAENMADVVSKYDVQEVLIVKNEFLNSYSADGYAEAVKQVVEQESPDYVLMGYSYQVRDFFPKVSARLNRPMIGDVVGIKYANGSPRFTRHVFYGKLVTDVLPGGDGPVLVAFQSAAFDADSIAAGSAETREVSVDLDASQIKSSNEEPIQEAAGDVDLTAADIVVSVGRGIGKEENIPQVQDLAKLLGGELGSSRPIVDAGWLESARQVGSSGQSVNPKLYFALGISGAIQHVVGMKGSKNIVAVNKDSDAPIFEIADYGVVGDLHEIVPKLIEALNT